MKKASPDQMSLWVGLPVSPTLWPDSEEARLMTVRSGRKCSESYERQGPLGSLARMCLESSAWHSTACLLIWSVKATPARRSLFQLAPWMQSTDETECGLWPTARSSSAMAEESERLEKIADERRKQEAAKHG